MVSSVERDLHPIHQPEDGIFNGFGGRKINLKNPCLDMIDINDIASSLSKICRFNGHISEFYSVAQHSTLVHYLAPRELQKAALLHDASEAYLGDVIKPLKILIGAKYEDLETRFEELICEKFKIDQQQMLEIKYYDKRAIEIEFEYFFKGKDSLIRIFGPEPCWDHHVSKQMFMYSFQEVTNA